jgi:ubiquinone/menaquinone biosynthesis C-methylase UbiE
MKLNLACEYNILEGYTNIDLYYKDPKVRNWDLNDGLPIISDNQVDEVIFEHGLTYLNNPAEFMHELHRVCKNGAKIRLIETHYSMGLANADFRKKQAGISYASFGNPNFNKEFYNLFKVKKAQLNFTRTKAVWLNLYINPWLNLFPLFYERFFAWILPCSEIKFILIVQK